MAWIYFSLLAVLGLVGLVLNVFKLPGNWMFLGLAAIFSALQGWQDPSWQWLLVALVLVGVGEIIETVFSIGGARLSGASRTATLAAVVGGIIGAVVGIPIPVIGNIVGAVVGCFVAPLLVELLKRKTPGASLKAATGAAVGFVFGTITKIAMGFVALIILLVSAFPG